MLLPPLPLLLPPPPQAQLVAVHSMPLPQAQLVRRHEQTSVCR
jgi:hypothetical protein